MGQSKWVKVNESMWVVDIMAILATLELLRGLLLGWQPAAL
jgi:hypothetical protein